METPEELAAMLAADTTERVCNRTIGEHRCCLGDCPPDDPDHMHRCYFNDCDFTEGEFQELRLGRLGELELMRRALIRAIERDQDGRRQAMVQFMQMTGRGALTPEGWVTADQIRELGP